MALEQAILSCGEGRSPWPRGFRPCQRLQWATSWPLMRAIATWARAGDPCLVAHEGHRRASLATLKKKRRREKYKNFKILLKFDTSASAVLRRMADSQAVLRRMADSHVINFLLKLIEQTQLIKNKKI